MTSLWRRFRARMRQLWHWLAPLHGECQGCGEHFNVPNYDGYCYRCKGGW